jgi:hypothetical protein
MADTAQTEKKIRKYMIAIVLFAAAAYYWRQSNPDWTLGASAMSGIGLSIAFMTTLYSIFSYATMDRIKAYLMLPCKKPRYFLVFVRAVFQPPLRAEELCHRLGGLFRKRAHPNDRVSFVERALYRSVVCRVHDEHQQKKEYFGDATACAHSVAVCFAYLCHDHVIG